MLNLKVIILVFSLTVSENFAKYAVLRINDGLIKGSTLTDIDGRFFFSFQSIPFAKPPIGKLRFKDPKPVEKWNGILDATKEAPICFQKILLLNEDFYGQEDCLYLNVYTPNLRPKSLLPVLVFIHGGSFIEGSGSYSSYGPEFIVSKNVILVTLNYRLGMLGFTSFNNPKVDVPGNAGLKDQTAALRWIQANIRYFGGNPNLVTISGESAGSVSVHLHVLSPLSNGLFKRGIMQSSSALAAWCNGEINNGVSSAKFLGFEGNDQLSMLEYLQNADLDQLKAASENTTFLVKINTPARFSPVVEYKSKKAFLTDDPSNILRRGNFNRDVELMMGMTNSEGTVLDAVLILLNGLFEPWPTNDFIPHYFNATSNEKIEIEKKLDDYYNTHDSNPDNHIALQTDSYFTFPIYEALFAHLNYNQDIFLYLFASTSELNTLKNSNNITRNYNGACHTDDLWYFYTHLETPPSAFANGSIENMAIRNSVSLLTNFVKFGKPTLPGDPVQWEKVRKGSIKYLKIDLNQNYVGEMFFEERMDFWCKLHEEYNLQHFCPLM
nr:juvenile hormone esterase-like isoform X1 [Onthophagus taurus]